MLGTPAIINVMMAAKKKAARKLVRDFGEVQYLRSSKNPLTTFVRHACIKAEESVLAELKLARPGFGIKSQILGTKPAADGKNYWVVNCLTAIENFTFGIPYFSISISQETETEAGEKEIIACVVDAVALGETYFAAKGQGAWVERNTHLAADTLKLRISANGDIAKSMILTTCNTALGLVDKYETRILGCPSISMAYVAAGKADIFTATNIHICNAAAGILMVKEAGGYIDKYTVDAAGVIDKLTVSNYEISEKAKKL